MMRPSMWTSYLIEMLPEEMVTCLTEHGWDVAELSDEHGHDLLKRGDPTRVGDAFKCFADDHGLSFPQGHFYLCNKGFRPEDMNGRRGADIAPADDADFSEAQEDMRRWIDLFNALGIEAGVLHLGGGRLKGAGWSEERVFARRVDALSRIAEYAKGGVTTICLENLGPDSGVQDAEQTLRVIEAVGAGNVAICLDTGHANINGVNCPDFIRAAGPLLKALHVADNLGQHDDHMIPYSRGTVPWTGVMEALRQSGYDGLFNYEIPGENRCPVPVRLAKLDYALELAKWMIEFDGVQ
ncbi:MAG: sugar phosphate isomerase/epimerase [Lentisphaerae bacterium]|nr:sugar phosphate isomerase/epimerase [Lentisphaerota bacterium]MBT4816409.1 sugar phosphate isomerase/epimerase [Lentisphaerota bacterium]MBT5611323.1 sugar phosphate isomerase/epimerase [Lentisphaerota bacterium]MBT7058151.1 sugar phosphate isomerase/epimerase [Lentisphaerota bacterium]MBT7848111.1 sugar phosphate isomerase/epimerase [Lentisphaerota bacterium]